jgi:hypothetical protein
MDIWISMHNSQMANNLVKWWKTKFLNGYKQFSVECGDGKVSDTEELLGRLGSEVDANERLRTACTTPPLQTQDETVPPPTPTEDSSTPNKQIPQHHLNFEVLQTFSTKPLGNCSFHLVSRMSRIDQRSFSRSLPHFINSQRSFFTQ